MDGWIGLFMASQFYSIDLYVYPCVSTTLFLKFNFILYSTFLLVIYFIHTIHPTPTPPLSPLGVHTFVLYICVSASALQT